MPSSLFSSHLGVFERSVNITPHRAQLWESMGYRTLWVGGAPNGDLVAIEGWLDATEELTLVSAVVNIWQYDARAVADACLRIEERHPGRFILGVGPGHRENDAARYDKPMVALHRYLDDLESAGIPGERVVLGAVGPRSLRLAAQRCAGAHPYLVTPEHTRRARDIMGGSRALVPVQAVVADEDRRRARELVRRRIGGTHLALSNYTRNLRTLGFDDDDFAGWGSDRLVDAVVAIGGAPVILERVRAHLDAGADQVAVQVFSESPDGAVDVHRQISAALQAILGDTDR